MGAGDAQTPRTRIEDAPQHHRPHLGGQYRVTPFGCPGYTDRAEVTAQVPAKAQAQPQAQVALTGLAAVQALERQIASLRAVALDALHEALAVLTADDIHALPKVRGAIAFLNRGTAAVPAIPTPNDAEALDQIERMKEEERAGGRATVTPAMERAAAASDVREQYRTDDEAAADYLASHGAEDAVGLTLAMQD